jgi:hypothetical protein
MPAFAYRILPPRADFVATITDGEAATMGAHFGFLQGLEVEGRVIFVGRCDNGDWGLGVFEFADEAEAGGAVARPCGRVGPHAHGASRVRRGHGARGDGRLTQSWWMNASPSVGLDQNANEGA